MCSFMYPKGYSGWKLTYALSVIKYLDVSHCFFFCVQFQIGAFDSCCLLFNGLFISFATGPTTSFLFFTSQSTK